MRVPDLADLIDQWEAGYSYDVLEMRMDSRDKLFQKNSEIMTDFISAVYQLSSQQLGVTAPWIPTQMESDKKST